MGVSRLAAAGMELKGATGILFLLPVGSACYY